MRSIDAPILLEVSQHGDTLKSLAEPHLNSEAGKKENKVGQGQRPRLRGGGAFVGAAIAGAQSQPREQLPYLLASVQLVCLWVSALCIASGLACTLAQQPVLKSVFECCRVTGKVSRFSGLSPGVKRGRPPLS